MHKEGLLIIAGKDPYCIPKPEGWEFANEESAKSGELITVKVTKDGEDKLRITEIEGMPVSGETEEEMGEEDIPYMPDMEEEE